MLKRDVFLPVDGEGPILVDGTTYASVAVCLEEEKTDTREQLEWRQLGSRHFSIFQKQMILTRRKTTFPGP